MAFVGLTVGAGFATGKEVIQYFISFGTMGLWGALLAGVVMTIAGAVILQTGSYFLAKEHNMVFRSVSHPWVSRFLDISVIITLFAVGFVMLAGAGANLNQQFGIPTWIGSAVMTAVVIAAGMLDVDKVSRIIGGLTPLIMVAVLIGFIYTLMNMPEDIGALNDLAQQEPSPVSPWFLSALNYNGLALLLGVSMTLVIGGNYASPKEAGRGGLMGGVIYTVMLLIAAVTLLLNIDIVAGKDVPMLELIDNIHPALGFAMAFVIFTMVFNTAIGMFYALGKRVTENSDRSFNKWFIGLTLVGFVISFVGFETLMQYVYPVLGYIGLVMVVTLVAWWVKSRVRIGKESKRRDRMRELAEHREDPEAEFPEEEEQELDKAAGECEPSDEEVKQAVDKEVTKENN
ncbi:MAG TPA: hypothetical protein H9867_03755 [Candidatus Corynebacterium gallistercoris]|uniref:Membrane protein YkvI n=1 Tax=Candidatus Corynebacterium gallistercoris TaxID=2838530 RepID=A0A9D1RZP0_9CORY|nr:hypothetical protein [Candidatus Corynebacterium gallistercoris]